MTTTDKREQMPDEAYLTPRGSGTVSGIYVDYPCGDEPRGEEPYIRKASIKVPDGLKDALLPYDQPDISGGLISKDISAIIEAARELLRIGENHG